MNNAANKGFFLWAINNKTGKASKLPTMDGLPLSEKDADVMRSKFSYHPARYIVVRPA